MYVFSSFPEWIQEGNVLPIFLPDRQLRISYSMHIYSATRIVILDDDSDHVQKVNLY